MTELLSVKLVAKQFHGEMRHNIYRAQHYQQALEVAQPENTLALDSRCRQIVHEKFKIRLKCSEFAGAYGTITKALLNLGMYELRAGVWATVLLARQPPQKRVALSYPLVFDRLTEFVKGEHFPTYLDTEKKPGELWVEDRVRRLMFSASTRTHRSNHPFFRDYVNAFVNVFLDPRLEAQNEKVILDSLLSLPPKKNGIRKQFPARGWGGSVP